MEILTYNLEEVNVFRQVIIIIIIIVVWFQK